MWDSETHVLTDSEKKYTLFLCLGVGELADQTEIDMPEDTVPSEQDNYEHANPQDYGIPYEPEDIGYGLYKFLFII